MKQLNESNLRKTAEAAKEILIAIGEDINRPGLVNTPTRIAKSLMFLTEGRDVHPNDIVGNGIFPAVSQGMIVQKNIEFYSLCEHHLLPFFGRVHVAYLPNKKIIGLSKIGRIIDLFAKRLQVQEQLTCQIAQGLYEVLSAKGIAVVVEAQHFCMMMRGVQKQGAYTITKEYLGDFLNASDLKNDFLKLINLSFV
jgi:GTP cyclohydrolase I